MKMKSKKIDCTNCLCRTCKNLNNKDVLCGNTEFYCKSICEGEFQRVKECQHYVPKIETA